MSDLFVTHHRGRFVENWKTWHNFTAMFGESRDADRIFQLAYMRKQMRYRAFQYAQARQWDIVWSE